MLDTNICIYLMKHQPPEVRARFQACYVGDVVISAITLAELEYGVASSEGSRVAHNQSVLNRLLEEIRVAPFDEGCARTYGPLRASNRARNKDALDKLIAAHAMALRVTLVTHNVAEYKNYKDLCIENWVNPH